MDVALDAAQGAALGGDSRLAGSEQARYLALALLVAEAAEERARDRGVQPREAAQHVGQGEEGDDAEHDGGDRDGRREGRGCGDRKSVV